MTHKMMSVRCPSCEQMVAVPVHQVRLNHCTTRKGADFSTFDCPDCGPVARHADASEFCILVGVGVPIRLYTFPLEMLDAERAAAEWSRYDEADILMDIAALPTFHGERQRLVSGEEAA